ncbi:hypothetical protein Tco_1470289 [Tanacetum coccineum]
MLRGLLFCREWSSIYRQKIQQSLRAVSAVPDTSGGPPGLQGGRPIDYTPIFVFLWRRFYMKWTLRGSRGESFWEEGDDFGVDVLHFHTCLTDILGFLEKLEWWFEQDIDDEGEENEENGGGDEV